MANSPSATDHSPVKTVKKSNFKLVSDEVNYQLLRKAIFAHFRENYNVKAVAGEVTVQSTRFARLDGRIGRLKTYLKLNLQEIVNHSS